MAAAERQLLADLDWQGDGLVGSASAAAEGGTSPAAAADGEVSLLPWPFDILCLLRVRASCVCSWLSLSSDSGPLSHNAHPCSMKR